MPLVWGVFPWKNLVLASDMNSGLWVFRVTGGTARGNGVTTTTAPLIAPPPRPIPAGDSDDPAAFLWVGLAGLALGLLAVGTVVRAARRRPG
jgi:hypothetical protein